MFKSMLLYRITNSEHIAILNDWARLNEALERQPEYQPTGPQWRGIGFTPYSPSVNEELVWSGANAVNLFTLAIHERALTAATIREHVLVRGQAIEAREQRKIYRKEYAEIKDAVIAELLPKAFMKRRRINALVINDLLVVGAPSAKLAEDFLCTLREAMDGLAVRPLSTKLAPQVWMADLIHSGGEGHIKLGDTAKVVNELKDTVTFKGIDLTEEEPRGYLHNGFSPKELALSLGTDFYFKVTDTLIFKGLKFSDQLVMDSRSDADGDLAAIVDADIILATDVIKRLVSAINDIAGEDKPDIVQAESTGLRMTHINNIPLEDLMTPAEKLLSLQEQFKVEPVTEDEDF